MNHLFSKEYADAELNRYARIDAERANGRKAGCMECNRRDAHPDVGVCHKCADKLVKEAAFLGFSITNPYRASPERNAT